MIVCRACMLVFALALGAFLWLHAPNTLVYAAGDGAVVQQGQPCVILRGVAFGTVGTNQAVTTPSGNFNGHCHADIPTGSPTGETSVIQKGPCFGTGFGTIVVTKSGRVEGECHVH